MSPARSIKVNAYSGYKANERPLSFVIKGLEKIVVEIKESWIEPDKNYFRIKSDDENVYILSWNRKKDKWYIENTEQEYSRSQLDKLCCSGSK